MPNFSDPIWGVIGVIATIVFGLFGIIGVILAFLQLIQTNKQLSFEFVSVTPILKIAKGFQDQVEIRFKQQVAKNLHLVVIRFSNSGKSSIKSDDYVRPLKFSVKTGQIISAEVIETDPNNLGDLIEITDSTSVVFKKTLLNSKDKFTVNILISEFSGKTKDIEVDARIDGVKSIKESHESAIIEALVGRSTSAPYTTAIALATILPVVVTLLLPVIGSVASTVLDKVVVSNKKKYNLFDE
ncbi:MAG: hypothetical protein HYZ22_13900 [Chloroflexi bacterium]|nr:hypothetical protein [Chloroflexota bacterium]